MIDLHYWAGLAVKLGQEKPTLAESLRDTKTQVMVSARQATEAKILKLHRKLTLLVSSCEDLDCLKLQAYEEKLSDLTASLTNYRRELVQKSLDYASDYFEGTNRNLSNDCSKLNTNDLKRLVGICRDALRRVGSCLTCKETDARHFLRLKSSMEEYLRLILMQIAKAGVTADDIAKHHSHNTQPCTN
jgi:hypothetical protein